MKVIKKIRPLRKTLAEFRQTRSKIAFVPTMGYLHEGHLALIRKARQTADIVVVSIFVNPAQFGRGEDLDKYPADIKRDIGLLKKEKVDILFLPDTMEMYPSGSSSTVIENDLSSELCGKFRPGHFQGVGTIVVKFLNIVKPDHVYFGKKDYQQYMVIKRIVRDLDLVVKVIGIDTVREKDGLALSSRNAYLDPAARKAAPAIHRALREAKFMRDSGVVKAGQILNRAKKILQSEPLIKIQYAELVDPSTLKPVKDLTGRKGLVAIACHIKGVRLIDNIVI